ncbi:MAG: hypothetical protein ACTHOG_01245 [Marmoricola sp.]
MKSVVVIIVVILAFAVALAGAMLLERRRNRAVLGNERAQGRNPDPDKGPNL